MLPCLHTLHLVSSVYRPDDTVVTSTAIGFDPVHLHGIIRVVNTPLRRARPKYTNAASIGTMVVWTDGQISHYAAGDANWENEMKCEFSGLLG